MMFGTEDDKDNFSTRQKTAIFNYLLVRESPETLRRLLMFEDLIINGYYKKFPDVIMYSYDDILAMENIGQPTEATLEKHADELGYRDMREVHNEAVFTAACELAKVRSREKAV